MGRGNDSDCCHNVAETAMATASKVVHGVVVNADLLHCDAELFS